jgi:hypothetical protein
MKTDAGIYEAIIDAAGDALALADRIRELEKQLPDSVVSKASCARSAALLTFLQLEGIWEILKRDERTKNNVSTVGAPISTMGERGG